MWSYEHLYLTCFCLFQSHNLASIFVPIKAKSLIISMVYFRGGQMRPIGKDITKHYQIACISMSYTLFAFCRLMFSMCLLFLFPDFVIVSPKIFVKEFGDFLMSCHQHCLGVNLLVQR